MTVPRIESMRAPADMVPTVGPARETNGIVMELTAVKRGIVANADRLRDALRTMDCSPLELTSVLAAIEHVIEEEKSR
jgi:hypothetical protein